MKIQTDKSETITKTITTSIICNCCGKTVKSDENGFNFSDITDIEIVFQYGSKFDTESWEFDLCDDCIEKITGTFKHQPEKTGIF